MKNYLQIALIITGVLLIPLQALAEKQYEITLKSGRTITTTGYYEEGDTLYYIKYGTSVGVKKDNVSEIKEIVENKETYDTVEMNPCTEKCGKTYRGCLNTDDNPRVQVLAKVRKDGRIAGRDQTACQLLYDDCLRMCKQ